MLEWNLRTWAAGAAMTCLLAACGGTAGPAATPASSGAPAAVSAAPALSAKPSAAPSTAASKPAGSSPASAKPAASGAASAAAGSKLTIYYPTTSATAGPLWIAKDGGIFEKNGLDVDVQLLQNPAGTAALVSGQVQMGLGGAGDMLGPVSSGDDLEILAVLTPTYPYIFEVASSIKTVDDLKGQKLGASQAGGSDYVAMQAMLAKLHLEPNKDVSILFMGGLQERTAAVLGGSVAGTMTSPPDTLLLESKGFHPLVDLAELKLPNASSALTAHKSWVSTNKGTVQKVVDSLVQGIAREKQDRAFTLSMYKKYLKVDEEAGLNAAYDFFAGKILPSVPAVTVEQFKDPVELLGKSNPKIKDIDIKSVIDNSFVEDAVRRGLAAK